jgi:hypothetical protein
MGTCLSCRHYTGDAYQGAGDCAIPFQECKWERQPAEVGDLVILLTWGIASPAWHVPIREGALYRVVEVTERGVVVTDPFLEDATRVNPTYVPWRGEYTVWHGYCK